MKIKWNGMDIELTVDEFQELITKGIFDPEDEKIPYPKEWEELLKNIPKMPQVQPGLQPYVEPKPDPFRGLGVMAYGCQPTPYNPTVTPQWNQTTGTTPTIRTFVSGKSTTGPSGGDAIDAKTNDGETK